MDNRIKLTIAQMLAKLDQIYEQEEKLCNQMNQLRKAYEQLLDDKEMLQNMIMYTSNKNNRGN